MIRAVRDIASKQGWRPEQIHFESFGGSAQADDRPIRVELARSQMSLEVAASQSILDAMLEAGVWAQFECKRGECGMCMTPVLEGEPDHRDVFLAESDRERFMCTCVSRAKGDRLVLDL
jgi:vanillate O-demethylase ferredoxin subunit